MDGLRRTFNERFSNYSPDGQGRDWYIMHNNGGVFKQSCVTGFNVVSSSTKKTFFRPQPKIQPKMTTYSPDGSGRDSYVMFNGGGLWGNSEMKPFHLELRNSSPYKTGTKDFRSSQQYWTRMNGKKVLSQSQLNQRLSIPKYTKQSFELSGSGCKKVKY